MTERCFKIVEVDRRPGTVPQPRIIDRCADLAAALRECGLLEPEEGVEIHVTYPDGAQHDLRSFLAANM